MRDPNRIHNFLYEIGELWKDNCPDWRFGQLMVNFITTYGDPFYMEEDKLLEKMKEFFKPLSEK